MPRSGQERGLAAQTFGSFLGPKFWFESFQNWQSEFLSVAVLGLLSIWLGERGSPRSKPLTAPHRKTGS